jgi:hypothetical protein
MAPQWWSSPRGRERYAAVGDHWLWSALPDWRGRVAVPVLTALFTTGLAVVLGYAVLKSGSVLLAAYLHALNDQVTAFLVALGYKPFNPAFSFGVGIYGIATLALVSLLVLRDPVWRGKSSNLTSPRREVINGLSQGFRCPFCDTHLCNSSSRSSLILRRRPLTFKRSWSCVRELLAEREELAVV